MCVWLNIREHRAEVWHLASVLYSVGSFELARFGSDGDSTIAESEDGYMFYVFIMYTFAHLLTRRSVVGCLRMGCCLHDDMVTMGFGPCMCVCLGMGGFMFWADIHVPFMYGVVSAFDGSRLLNDVKLSLALSFKGKIAKRPLVLWWFLGCLVRLCGISLRVLLAAAWLRLPSSSPNFFIYIVALTFGLVGDNDAWALETCFWGVGLSSYWVEYEETR